MSFMQDIVSKFNQQADSHSKSQSLNPFSDQFQQSRSPSPRFSREEYGKPVAGSKTDLRGRKAKTHICREILELCTVIHDVGTYKAQKRVPDEDDDDLEDDGTIIVSFGELFQIYTKISDKVVGLLIAAKRRGFVYFDREILFQRRDDDVLIALLKPISEIKKILTEDINQANGVVSTPESNPTVEKKKSGKTKRAKPQTAGNEDTNSAGTVEVPVVNGCGDGMAVDSESVVNAIDGHPDTGTEVIGVSEGVVTEENNDTTLVSVGVEENNDTEMEKIGADIGTDVIDVPEGIVTEENNDTTMVSVGVEENNDTETEKIGADIGTDVINIEPEGIAMEENNDTTLESVAVEENNGTTLESVGVEENNDTATENVGADIGTDVIDVPERIVTEENNGKTLESVAVEENNGTTLESVGVEENNGTTLESVGVEENNDTVTENIGADIGTVVNDVPEGIVTEENNDTVTESVDAHVRSDDEVTTILGPDGIERTAETAETAECEVNGLGDEVGVFNGDSLNDEHSGGVTTTIETGKNRGTGSTATMGMTDVTAGAGDETTKNPNENC